jgi:signal transduction histidine kinase
MTTTPERLAAGGAPGSAATWRGADATRVAALVELGIALSSTLELDALLALVVERAAQLLGADGATLFLVDRDTGELWSKVLRGAKVREIRLSAGRGIAGWVARTRRPANVADAYADDRFDPAVDRRTGYRTRSVACAPLADRAGRVVGVIEVIDRRPGAFGPEEEQLLAAVASQTAVALENARLFSEAGERNEALAAARGELERRVAELDLLLGLERRLGGAVDLVAGLDAVLERAMHVVGAEAGSVLLVDQSSGQLYFRTARGGRPEALRTLRIERGRGIAGTVAVLGRPILANDVTQESAFDPELAERIGYPVASALCVPIGEGEPVGALELLNKKGGFSAEDEQVLAVVAAQVGRRVEVERARERQGREDRLAMIGQLLSGVLHDVRNPLTAVAGYTQLMALERDAGERKKTCQMLLRQLEVVDAMTREVLDFARGKVAVLKRRVAVGPFMAELEELLARELASSGVTLRVRISYPGPARFDVVKIRRAIVNVARNAGQAMKDGGRFSIHVAKQGGRITFSMSDTGPGIPEEIRDHLFESFATHGKEDGTGLGLAIVKRIAEEHGGSIAFRTRTGKGTTFVLSIPA